MSGVLGARRAGARVLGARRGSFGPFHLDARVRGCWARPVRPIPHSFDDFATPFVAAGGRLGTYAQVTVDRVPTRLWNPLYSPPFRRKVVKTVRFGAGCLLRPRFRLAWRPDARRPALAIGPAPPGLSPPRLAAGSWRGRRAVLRPVARRPPLPPPDAPACRGRSSWFRPAARRPAARLQPAPPPGPSVRRPSPALPAGPGACCSAPAPPRRAPRPPVCFSSSGMPAPAIGPAPPGPSPPRLAAGSWRGRRAALRSVARRPPRPRPLRPAPARPAARSRRSAPHRPALGLGVRRPRPAPARPCPRPRRLL